MAVLVSLWMVSIALLAVCTSASEHYPASFGYSGVNGPEKWGSLSPQYSTCSNGKAQSPVDIKRDVMVPNKNLRSLARQYKLANATLINNGFSIGVHFDGDVGGFNLDGKNYILQQLHWHSPSEHQIDGQQAAAELHLVHKAIDGTLSVVAVLHEIGDADPLIAKVGNKLVEIAKQKHSATEAPKIALGTFDVKHLERKTRRYFRYHGSLTTPPCTEKVTWNVLGKVRTISKQQLELLKAPLQQACKNNARPVQPLNGRKIELFDELSQI
ncbi:Alpha carbonic anhydrase [Quillaja saponaria]|uniref:Alpha carbonic anhydrase n=1 Tax=Quillaja saponaria TaxID=32244 RepID=A0AAD7VHK7_QUISA|nr:Alpha carbonic anhydrase [Quillaja saponaria]